MIFSLFGAAIGLICKNTYIAGVLFLLVALVMLAAPYLFGETGIWGGYFIVQFLPVCLWFALPKWLTDMGGLSLIPFHETVGIIGNLVVWGLLTFALGRRFLRKDVLS